ncbi:MAG: RNA polymerase factor sigma-54 [Oscillospiraceae bacterium]|jgi:RNA polymerase sigma-54 factor
MKLELVQKQKQVITLQMQQSLKILQMNALDLEQYIQNEVLENPLLELEMPAQEEDPGEARLKKLEWLESMDNSNTYQYASFYPEDSGESPLYEKKAQDSLTDVLLQQLPGFRLDRALELLVRRIIENLDENGYLTCTKEQLALFLKVTPQKLEEALTVLHRMDPPGVGAEDLRECLLIQAHRMEHPSPLLFTLIESHLDTLAKNHLDKLAQDLNVTIGEVKEARTQLLTLNPKPGNGYCAYNAIPYIRPDLFVVHFEGRFEIIYNDYHQPKITLNAFYRNFANSEDKEATAYIKERLQKAEHLIASIHQRKTTILDCAGSIVRRQTRFFKEGPGHLAPMTLADVAEDLDIHPSTVSRAISDKYLQCQWGTYRLGDFFSRNVSKHSENTSQDMAITQLQHIIEEENPKKPFSDQQLAQRLEQLGISISRRTVAKYRNLAGIPPASGRKKF